MNCTSKLIDLTEVFCFQLLCVKGQLDEHILNASCVIFTIASYGVVSSFTASARSV